MRYFELLEIDPFPDVDTFAPLTDAPPAAGTYYNISASSLDVPGDTDITVDTAFGRATSEIEPGYYAPSGNVSYPANLVNILEVLKGVLGGYAFTAGTVNTPNTHEFWGSDTRLLSSWVGRLGKDNFEHGFQGLVMESMSCEVAEALTNISWEMSGQKDFKAPEGLQSKSAVRAKLPKERKIPFHQVTLTIDGVLQKRKAKGISWNVSNGTDAGAGQYLGSRYPGRIPANARSTSASTTLDFSDLSAIERVWGGPSGPTALGGAEFPCQIDYAGGKSVAFPTSPPLSMTVKLPRVNYSSVETTASGREEISQPISINARTGTVLLLDGTTTVETDIYVVVYNYEPMILPYAA